MARIIRIDIDYPFAINESETRLFVEVPDDASVNDMEEIAREAFFNKVNYGASEVTEEEMLEAGGWLE